MAQQLAESPSRAELLAALSVAVDLGLGQPGEHMLRSALIATRLADRLGLSGPQRDAVYYTTLVMWIGCHADSHEYARWFGDDIAVRHDSYLIEATGLPFLRFLVGNIARGEPLARRLNVLAALFVNARGRLAELIHSHCTSAALLADRLGLGPDVQAAVAFAFERYDGGGMPNGARGADIPIQMRIAQLADQVEVRHRTHGVTASDLTPELFDAGREIAAERGLELTWIEADAEALPFPDGSFDVVMSCVGAMFAPHHQAAADELVRVCRSGGTIAMINWTPAGFIGRLFATMKPYAPPLPAGASPAPWWGDPDHVRELFGAKVTDLTMRTRTVVMDRCATPMEFREYWKTNYGPTIAVYNYNAGSAERLDALDRDFLTFLTESDQAASDQAASDQATEPGRTGYPAEYLLITARVV